MIGEHSAEHHIGDLHHNIRHNIRPTSPRPVLSCGAPNDMASCERRLVAPLVRSIRRKGRRSESTQAGKLRLGRIKMLRRCLQSLASRNFEELSRRVKLVIQFFQCFSRLDNPLARLSLIARQLISDKASISQGLPSCVANDASFTTPSGISTSNRACSCNFPGMSLSGSLAFATSDSKSPIMYEIIQRYSF